MAIDDETPWQIEGLEALLEQAPVAAIITDRTGRTRLWNDRAAAMFGWTAQEATGRPLHELIAPDETSAPASALIRVVARGRVWAGTVTARQRDGTSLDLEVVNAPLTDADGDPRGVLAMAVDAHASHWRRLLEHGADALSLHDPDGTFLYASPAFGHLLGLPSADLVGRTAYELFHPEERDELAALHATLLAGGGPQVTPYRLRRPDGAYVWVEGSLRWDPEGNVLIAQVRSIRARRSLLHGLEHQRTLAARMQDLQTQQRQFLTSVSHRIRTPMTAVLGFSRLLARLLPPEADPRLHQAVRRLNDNVDELTGIVEAVTHSDLLARGAQPVRRQPVDLHTLAVETVAERATADSAFTVAIPAGTRVFADPDLLRQALRALVHNVVVHTPVGTLCQIRSDVADDHVDLVVEDHGPGVPKVFRGHIWEPFRHGIEDDVDPGMGLGLYVVAQTATAHGGHAWVEDRTDGDGACFRLRIPQRGRGSDA